MNSISGQSIASVYVHATQALRASSDAITQFTATAIEDNEQLRHLEVQLHEAHLNWDNATFLLRSLPITQKDIALTIIKQELNI